MKKSRKALLAEVRRLKLQIKSILSIKVELQAGKDGYNKISVAQLHAYFREHGWEPLLGNLRLWTNHEVMEDGSPFTYFTLDREGYADHASRISETIQMLSAWEERSPIAVYLDLLDTKTNALDKLADAVSEN